MGGDLKAAHFYIKNTMAQVDTVEVKGDVEAGEPAVITINKEDYNRKVHVLASQADESKNAKSAKASHKGK